MNSKIIAALLVSAFSLRADALADLKSAINRLPGGDAIQVHLNYTTSLKVNQKGAIVSSGANVALELSEDTQSLKMVWDAGDARRVNEEARAHDHDPKQPTPLREAMKDLDPGRLSHLVNQAVILRGLLEDSHLETETTDSFDGKPTQLMTFTFKQRIPFSLLARLIRSDATLKIWVDEKGIPLASETITHYEGKRGRIFGSYSGSTKMTTHYAVEKDRLLVLSRNMEETHTEEGRTTLARKDTIIQPR